MGGYPALALLIAGLALAGCTSDPYAPVNQAAPIRQLDHFFDSLSGPPAEAPPRRLDYTHVPGYAPAYPAY